MYNKDFNLLNIKLIVESFLDYIGEEEFLKLYLEEVLLLFIFLEFF